MNQNTIKLTSQVQSLFEEGKINKADQRTVERELSYILGGGEMLPTTEKWLQSLVNRQGAAFILDPETEKSEVSQK